MMQPRPPCLHRHRCGGRREDGKKRSKRSHHGAGAEEEERSTRTGEHTPRQTRVAQHDAIENGYSTRPERGLTSIFFLMALSFFVEFLASSASTGLMSTAV